MFLDIKLQNKNNIIFSNDLYQGHANFIKDETVNILDFMGYVIAITSILLCFVA